MNSKYIAIGWAFVVFILLGVLWKFVATFQREHFQLLPKIPVDMFRKPAEEEIPKQLEKLPQNAVTVFIANNFGGTATQLSPGRYENTNLQYLRLDPPNGGFASMYIPKDMELITFSDPNFKGKVKRYMGVVRSISAANEIDTANLKSQNVQVRSLIVTKRIDIESETFKILDLYGNTWKGERLEDGRTRIHIGMTSTVYQQPSISNLKSESEIRLRALKVTLQNMKSVVPQIANASTDTLNKIRAFLSQTKGAYVLIDAVTQKYVYSDPNDGKYYIGEQQDPIMMMVVFVPIMSKGVNAYQILPVYKNYETIGSTSMIVGHNAEDDTVINDTPKDVISTSPPEPVLGGKVWVVGHPNV